MIRRALTRIARTLVPRSYDGAGGGRRWRGAGEMPFTLAAQQAARGPLARRARYLTANNGNAAAGVAAWTSALIGTGIKPQSAHPDPAVRAHLNQAFETWTDRADADALADFYALQQIAARSMIVDGDCFTLITVTQPGDLRVKLLPAEQIDPGMHRELGGGARIIAGVELDATGRRVAYHALRERPGLPLGAGSPLDTMRLPAEDCLHLFRVETPGQVRGISWLSPIMLRAHEYDTAVDAQLMRQKTAALFAGFIVDASGEAAGFTGPQTAHGVIDGGLEPGTLKVLDAGKDIRFSDPADIGAEAIAFLKTTAHEIAAGLGVPFEAMTGDLSGVNYSSIRAGLVEFRRRVEAIQHGTVVYQLCRPVWRRFVTLEVLTGRLRAPDFMRNPEAYLSARWITPRFDWVDPYKDGLADVIAVRSGLKSWQETVAERGRNPEDVLAEIAAFNAAIDAAGIVLDSDPRKTSRAGLTQARPSGTQLPGTQVPGAEDLDDAA